MKRGFSLVLVLISVMLILSLGVVSAGLFNKNKITGDAVELPENPENVGKCGNSLLNDGVLRKIFGIWKHRCTTK